MAKVAVVMGSQSDWATMRHAVDILDVLGVPHEVRIVSAHRTPERLYAFARGARAAVFSVIIAGAGGAAHLPGMIAAAPAAASFSSRICSNISSRSTEASGGKLKPSFTDLPRTSTTRTSIALLMITASPTRRER